MACGVDQRAAVAAAAGRRGQTRRCRRPARRRSSSGTGTRAPPLRTRSSGSAASAGAPRHSRRACRSSSRRRSRAVPTRRGSGAGATAPGGTRTSTRDEVTSSGSAPSREGGEETADLERARGDGGTVHIDETAAVPPGGVLQARSVRPGPRATSGVTMAAASPASAAAPVRRQQAAAGDALDPVAQPGRHRVGLTGVTVVHRSCLYRGYLGHEPGPGDREGEPEGQEPRRRGSAPRSCVSGSRIRSAANPRAAAIVARSRPATMYSSPAVATILAGLLAGGGLLRRARASGLPRAAAPDGEHEDGAARPRCRSRWRRIRSAGWVIGLGSAVRSPRRRATMRSATIAKSQAAMPSVIGPIRPISQPPGSAGWSVLCT